MCGIAGIFQGDGVAGGLDGERRLVERMTSALTHRGPDADGLWQDARGRCTLGHRRLSIIDVSDAGAQPMRAAGSSWVLSYNGEIYNYRDLRADLEREGCRFQGHSDTEVLLQAITRWGPADTLARLDGMFAVAAFNTDTGELVLARDPFGEKPLYYCDAGSAGIAFASELTALAEAPWLSRSVPAERLAELLMFQYVGAPRSIYDGASKLPPGHMLLLAPGRAPRVTRYFGFEPQDPAGDDRPLWQAADELEELLVTSLDRRLMSDVPLGALLSGGIDSALACALVRRRLGVPLATFSLGFKDAAESETDVARAFAHAIGSEHHELIVDASAVDFLRHSGEQLDEPNGDVSCFPTYVLAKLVREHVTVAISGDGGDEMFGGYNRYLDTLADVAARPLAPLGSEYYSGRLLTMSELEIRSLFGEVPAGLRAHLTALREQVEAGRDAPLAAMRGSDATNYMPGAVLAKVDRMSMRHSLEVRTPYLSPDVGAFAARLPARLLSHPGRGKLVLREVAYRHLPRELVDLPKKGFGLPSQGWASGAVEALARELLGGGESRLRGALGGERIDHFLSRPFRLEPLWAMCGLESWLRTHEPDVERTAPARSTTRQLESPTPPMTTRRARWLTERTLLLVDEDLCDPAANAEVDGRTGLGRGVTSRAIRTLKALRPLIEDEPPAPHEGWIRLDASSRPAAALRAAGIDVRDARVVWFRTDALVAHGRRARAVRREPGGLSVSLGLETWRVRSYGVASEAAALTGSEALLVVNPLDDSTALPIVAHHRRASRDRVRRAASRRRAPAAALRPPAPGEPERIVRDIDSAAGPDGEGPAELHRVVLTTHALPPGGAERQWCYLAQGLRREGIDARLVTTHAVIGRDAHYVPMLTESDVPVLELPDLDAGTLLEGVDGADLLSEVQSHDTELSDISLRLSCVLRSTAPDAALGQLDGTNIAMGLAGVRAGIPNVVLSFRNYNPDNFSYLRTDWYRSSYRALAERPEVVLSGNSRAGNDDYAEWIGVAPERVHTVPNGVSAGAISLDMHAGGAERARRDLGLGPDDPVVLGVFRLSEEKRPELFVEACARAAARIPRLRVLIAGVGPLEGEVRRLADLYGMEDTLRLLGARRDVADLLDLADLLLVTSRFEGMPNVVLEAQISAVPVVAPPVGAVPDIVVAGETGVITDSEGAADFADAIVEVLRDPAPWAQRCAARRDALAAEFSVEHMVTRYRTLALGASAGATPQTGPPSP